MRRRLAVLLLAPGCHAPPSETATAPPPPSATAPASATTPAVAPPAASSSTKPVASARPAPSAPVPTPPVSVAPPTKLFAAPEDCHDLCGKAETCLRDHKLASCDDVCGGDRSPFPEYGCIATEVGRSEGWECRPIVSCIKAGASGTGGRRKGDEGRMGPPRR